MIGMGRLGGAELSYASDIDVMFVFDGDGAADFDRAERVATRLMSAIGETTAEGQTFRIDARLRPEGNQGLLARSLARYEAYWRQRAEVGSSRRSPRLARRGRCRARRRVPRAAPTSTCTAIRSPKSGGARSGA